MAVVNSKLLKIYYDVDGGTPAAVTCLTDAEITINNEVFDVTCKDSGQWREVIPGQTTATLSGTLFVDYSASNGHDEIATDVIAQALLDWEFGTGTTGHTKFSGGGYFTNFTVTSSGQNEGVTASFEITVTGAVTQGTYS